MKKASLVLLAVLGCASTAMAQTAALPHSGRLLASNCFQCHGTDGRSKLGFDRLAGKSVNDIYGDLIEMKAKPGSEGIMGVHAMGYTDAQIREIADYFSKQAR
jgi:sulfide dehydrogenase cytochrome subunit